MINHFVTAPFFGTLAISEKAKVRLRRSAKNAKVRFILKKHL